MSYSFKNSFILRGTLFILTILILPSFIIIRHDGSDSNYVNLAKEFKRSVCHLNLGDSIPDGEGTLIDQYWVLTAAHCAIEIQEKLDSGINHTVTINNQTYQIDKVIIHSNWHYNEAYDIALLHLSQRAKNAQPVPIYMGKNELNQLVYLVGAGDTGNGKVGITGNDRKLRAATNRVDEATEYWLKWKFDNPDSKTDRITEMEGISGPGDSGGPAFIKINNKFYLAGISSGQSTRNTQGIEGVYGVIEYYTRVSNYSNWIVENMH